MTPQKLLLLSRIWYSSITAHLLQLKATGDFLLNLSFSDLDDVNITNSRSGNTNCCYFKRPNMSNSQKIADHRYLWSPLILSQATQRGAMVLNLYSSFMSKDKTADFYINCQRTRGRIGSIPNNVDALTNLLESEKRFRLSDINDVASSGDECKDDSETEDDSDDEDVVVGDDSDNDAEDSSGEDNDDEEGDDSDSDANEDAGSDDDDDDDEDDDDDDDEDDDDDAEEEENQPPFKKKK